MNITFENGRAENEVKSTAVSAARSHVDKTAASQNHTSVFALDISGTVMDNTAYEGQGKTAEDVMQNAGQIDVATQKNYMAVMSNTMSDEDFAKLQEEGYHPGNTEIETVVTIVDQIKAALAKGGNHITGYTDDLDVETLAQITGSTGLAEEIVKQFAEHDIPVTKENVEDVLKACDTVTKLNDLSDGVIKYMIRNQMEPTVDNIYLAQYSASADADKQGKGYYQDDNGYYAKKAESYDWQQLGPQMQKVIENAGLKVCEETLSDAKWLIEKGMALTEDNLNALYQLRNLEVPDTMEGIVSAGAAAIANGKNAGSANIADDRTDVEKALDYMADAESISDEAVDKAAAEGKILNIRNLKAAQIQLNLNVKAEVYSVSFGGRRLMEEVRLQMTVEANIRLVKSGFSIDTAPLEQLVEALKAAESRNNEQLFGEAGMTKLGGQASGIFNRTLATVRELCGMPAALVGKFAYQGSSRINLTASAYTLEAAYTEGTVLRSAYEKAGESYETLMTAPRADLGDSIKKAFRNVDSILEDMGLEISEQNRRAVRILGYNRMEISEENIEAVKTADLSIQRVLHKMTPASTLQMIRDGINPLSMNMEELESYLDGQDRRPEQEIEKYSEYLYKLEKNNAVTEQERDAYIGIYRLFRQLQKTDGAAIGALIHQGMEPTVKNLLSAMRSNKKHGMDVTVNDAFGGVTSSYEGKSISEQISGAYDPTPSDSTYYRKLAADIFDRLDGSKMNAVPAGGDMSLEQMAQILQDTQPEEEIRKEYLKQQAADIREGMTAEEATVKELLDFKQPVTADNLLAAGLLMKERGKSAGRIFELAGETEAEEALQEALEGFYDSLTDEESAKEAYGELEQTCMNILDHAVYEKDSLESIDIREINNLYKQISLAGNLAKEENYEVPVEINGEVTAINLKILHGNKENGKVAAVMESAVYGQVEAQFAIAAGTDGSSRLSGYIACDTAASVKMLEQSRELLKKALESADIKVVSLNYIYSKASNGRPQTLRTGTDYSIPSKQMDERAGGQLPAAEKTVSTKKLYETAKIFIGYIQKG